jgi:hypothetical protein
MFEVTDHLSWLLQIMYMYEALCCALLNTYMSIKNIQMKKVYD